ncbi:MAG: hypothetical protein AAF550_02695 [Myxococcota bacterium]
MSEILKDKIERAKQEIELHVGTCGAPNCRRKGLSEIFHKTVETYSRGEHGDRNKFLQRTIRDLFDKNIRVIEDQFCNTMDNIYSYIKSVPADFSKSINSLLKHDMYNKVCSGELANKIKKTIISVTNICKKYASINSQYKEGLGVTADQMASLEKDLSDLRIDLIELNHSVVEVSTLYHGEGTRTQHRKNARELKRLFRQAIKARESQQKTITSLTETSRRCLVEPLHAVQSCLALVADVAVAAQDHTRERAHEIRSDSHDTNRPTVCDPASMMRRISSILTQMSPLISAQASVGIEGATLGNSDGWYARMPSVQAQLGIMLRNCCPTFLGSPFQPPYNNSHEIDRGIARLELSWANLTTSFHFRSKRPHSEVDKHLRTMLLEEGSWMPRLQAEIHQLAAAYVTGMRDIDQQIRDVERDLGLFKRNSRALSDRRSPQTPARAEPRPAAAASPAKTFRQGASQTGALLHPEPTPSTLPSATGFTGAGPVDSTFGRTAGRHEDPPEFKKARRRYQRAQSNDHRASTLTAIKTQPLPGHHEISVRWGFFAAGEMTLFDELCSNHLPCADILAWNTIVLREIERPNRPLANHCFTGRFQNRNLMHFTIPRINIALFYTHIENEVAIYIVARHVGRGNDRYRGEGSVPESPGRQFSTTVTLK